MAEFLVETYAPREMVDAGGVRFEDIARAADQVGEPGRKVRFLRAIFVPEEETCFYLYESSSVAAVRDAATRACLPFERITEVISITPRGAVLEMCNRTRSAPNWHTITRPEGI